MHSRSIDNDIEDKLFTTFLLMLYTSAIVHAKFSVKPTLYDLFVKQPLISLSLHIFTLLYIATFQMVFFNDAGDLKNVQIAYISIKDNYSFQYVNSETDRTVFPG